MKKILLFGFLISIGFTHCVEVREPAIENLKDLVKKEREDFNKKTVCELFNIPKSNFNQLVQREVNQIPYWMKERNGSRVYLFEGRGLWDKIYAFTLVDKDLSKIESIIFDHKGETPEYGAKIKDDANFKKNFNKILMKDNKGDLLTMKIDTVSKRIIIGDVEIDGITGATVTVDGVCEMINKGFEKIQENK